LNNLGTIEEILDADLEYFIKDKKEEIYFSEKEKINITDEKVLLREIDIPRKMKAGNYFFVGKIEYLESEDTDEDEFKLLKVEKPEKPACCLGNICWFRFLVCWYWWALVLILIILFRFRKRFRYIEFYYRVHKGRHRRRFGRHRRRIAGEKESLKNLDRYIRGSE